MIAYRIWRTNRDIKKMGAMSLTVSRAMLNFYQLL